MGEFEFDRAASTPPLALTHVPRPAAQRRRGRGAVALTAAAALGLVVAVVVAFGGDAAVPGAARAAARPVAAPQQPAPQAAGAGVGSFVTPELPVQVPAPTQAPAAQPPAQPKPEPKTSGQRPGTVRLAKGGTATLVRQELGPDATLPVPTSLREATWWGAGLDAASGATVLAGHVNWKGQVGPFNELWVARSGDPVSVVDAAGQTWAYRVSAVETVAKHDLPNRAEELFGQAGPHRLVLVTCGGRWVGGPDGYESNRIVIASPA